MDQKRQNEIIAELKRRGVSDEEIKKAMGGRKSSAIAAVPQGLAESLVGGILGTADFGLKAARGGGNVLRAMTGQKMLPVPQGGFLPSGQEAVAKMESVPNLLGLGGPTYDEALDRRKSQQESHPVPHAIGGILGDVANLATLKAPVKDVFRTPRRNYEGATFDDILSGKTPEQMKAIEQSAKRPSLFADEAAKITSAKRKDAIADAITRMAETGLDTAMIAVMNEQDPFKAAAAGAGAQMGADAVVGLKNRYGKIPERAFFGLWFANQLYRTYGPGEKNIYESSDMAINELAAIFALGALGGVGRRVPEGTFSNKDSQLIAEQMADAVRAGVISPMLRWLNDNPDAGEQAQNLPPEYQQKLFDAAEKGKEELDKVWAEIREDKVVQDVLGLGRLGAVPEKK